ncbi:MAG: hypothetical protein LBU22_07010 [Dysgonamonadaceae bacterium]|jgi:phosphatidylserine synthase|nr:hypothetical protein [Dysgonamonadaceae bacterium]
MASIILSAFSFVINIPVGIWREHYKKFSFPWILIVHVSVPFIIALRMYLEANRLFIPLFIALAVVGQLVGKRIKKQKNKPPG